MQKQCQEWHGLRLECTHDENAENTSCRTFRNTKISIFKFKSGTAKVRQSDDLRARANVHSLSTVEQVRTANIILQALKMIAEHLH